MEAWTGVRWMVLIAPQGGDEPLQKQREDARDTVFKQARQHHIVQAVFEKFPDAQIIDVSDPASDMDNMMVGVPPELSDEDAE